MTIKAHYSPKEYLAHMKSNMSGHFEFGCERFTGFFLGRLFYVTYHSGYEFNRRITNQKNAAMGYLKKDADGCSVHFLRFRGALCPAQFLSLLLTLLLLLTLPMLLEVGWHLQAFLFLCGCAFVLTVITALIGTLMEYLTENSEDGRRTLLSMLIDPHDALANYNKV